MVKFAQDYLTCRKILFEKYFSLDSNTAKNKSDGLVNKITPDQPCGICDNCTRSKDSVVIENIRDEAESIIRLCDILKQHNERVTMNKLVQMLQGRGLGVVKSRVLNDSKIKIPINRKYSEYVSIIYV
jgi:ATP-dependent DNA helicase Q1